MGCQADTSCVAPDARDPLSDPLERGAANTPGTWFPEVAYIDGKVWRRLGVRGVWTMSVMAAALLVVLLVWLFT
jgi:hypothetical protein